MQNSYVISSLTITGQGVVNIDCGLQNFIDLEYNTGRIVNVRLENLDVRGGVGKIILLAPVVSPLAVYVK